MGFDAFGLPAEQYAVQTGTHPRSTTEDNVERYREQLRRLGLGHDDRRSVATTDVEFYRWTQWIFLQIFNSWYDEDAAQGPADRRAGGRAGRRHPAHSATGGAWSELTEVERRRLIDSLPAGLRLRGAGQLVPRAGHGAGQRGGHRRRAQRARQLPGVPPQPEAVDDADHRLRRPAGRRPGPAGLAGLGQGDAAQLDRPLRGRASRASRSPAGTADRGLHHPPGHPVRRHLHGAGPGAPAGRRDHPGAVAGRASTRAGPAARPPRPRRWPPTGPRPPASPSWTGRRTRTRPASSPARTRSTRSTASRSRCSWPTTC